MKKVKLVLLAVLIGVFCSCTKSAVLDPVPLADMPHKKDTVINNEVPRILFRN